MSHQPLSQAPLFKGGVSGEQEIEGAAETIDVGSGIDFMAVDGLFG